MPRLRIECTVPADWVDRTSASGILENPYDDVTNALLDLGVEDIDTELVEDGE